MVTLNIQCLPDFLTNENDRTMKTCSYRAIYESSNFESSRTRLEFAKTQANELLANVIITFKYDILRDLWSFPDVDVAFDHQTKFALFCSLSDAFIL